MFMFFDPQSDAGFNPLRLVGRSQMLAGGALVLLAILILVAPQLLAAMVATVLLMGGVSLIAGGWRQSRVRPDRVRVHVRRM